MHIRLAHLAHTARNPDFAKVCDLLSHYSPGDQIDADACAKVLGMEPTLFMFCLDHLMELGAVLGPNTPEPMRAAA